MMTKKYSFAAIGVLLLGALAVSATAQENQGITYSGQVTLGGQLTNSPASSKFNEYRALDDGVFLPGYGLEVLENGSGLYLESSGSSLFRKDLNVGARVGKYGQWNFELEYDRLPHLLSNKAKSPFTHQGNGLMTVATPIAGLEKNIAPGRNEGAGNANVNYTYLTNDPIVGTYMATQAKPVDLGMQFNNGTARMQYRLMDDLKFRVSFDNQTQLGSRIGYGPIGDRPPRTLNIQFAEPVDERANRLTFEADYAKEGFFANLAYQYSIFKNNLHNLTWQNMYTTTTDAQEVWVDNNGNNADTTRRVAAFGRRALAPDNHFHNVTLTAGLDLPFDSRLTGTLGLSYFRQDETLIPYSTITTLDNSTDAADKGGLAWNDPAKLARQTAQGSINTRLYSFDYTISPLDRLNVRAFYRLYDMDNKTPEDNWRYVTDDTINGNGGVNYVNRRRSVAYASDKTNFGLTTGYRFDFWRSNLGLGYERENLNRTYREANTGDDIFKANLRMRPLNWMTLRTKAEYGNRKEHDENPWAVSETYWYSPTQATDNNDPKFAFENHPDTRQYDVSDRKRYLIEIAALMNPLERLDLGASVRSHRNDFNSHVGSSAPLSGYAARGGVATGITGNTTAVTPGQQLGLLKNDLIQYAVDGTYAVNDDLSFTAFTSWEKVNLSQRGIEFNENNRVNPNSVSGTDELGPWTRANSQWVMDTTDSTRTVGLGARFAIIPSKLVFATDHTYSLGKVDLVYSGFGVQSSVDPANTLADNYQFAFRTPPSVRHTRYTADFSLSYSVLKDLDVGFFYMFERYAVQDYMQESPTPWVERVESENLTRDTSRSTQWGNRLPNLGSLLAPSYVAHVGTVTLTYKF